MEFTFGTPEPETPAGEDTSPIDLGRCSVAGCPNPLPEYTGRGRKPKRCDEHKGTRGATDVKSSRASAKNAALARDANFVLSQLDSVVALSFFGLGYPETHGAIETASENIMAERERALMSNPKLCQSLTKVGDNLGIFALAMCYGKMAGQFAPVMIAEHRAKQALKAVDEY